MILFRLPYSLSVGVKKRKLACFDKALLLVEFVKILHSCVAWQDWLGWWSDLAPDGIGSAYVNGLDGVVQLLDRLDLAWKDRLAGWADLTKDGTGGSQGKRKESEKYFLEEHLGDDGSRCS